MDWDARLVLSLPARRAWCSGEDTWKAVPGVDGNETEGEKGVEHQNGDGNRKDTRRKTGNGRPGELLLPKQGGTSVLETLYFNCISGIV